MNISQLLESLKDPSAALSIGDKLLGGFIVAILSMSVVFIVLVIIQGIISLLQREKAKPVTAQIVSSEPLNMQEVINETQDMGELVAVITSAICAATGNNTNNVLVRKIVRSNNSKSSWESMSKNTTK